MEIDYTTTAISVAKGGLCPKSALLQGGRTLQSASIGDKFSTAKICVEDPLTGDYLKVVALSFVGLSRLFFRVCVKDVFDVCHVGERGVPCPL